MHKFTLACVLVLLASVAARADSSVEFLNSGGTISGNSTGLTLTGSTLIQMGSVTGSLGSVAFKTGGLTSGSLSAGGTFNWVGSSFTITGNGTGSIPNGVIFAGTFDGPIQWTHQTIAGPSGALLHSYVLSGIINGMYFLPDGSFVTTAATVQLTTIGRNNLFTGGSINLSGGSTSVAVAEPNTLVLFGAGLMGVAALIRRRSSSTS